MDSFFSFHFATVRLARSMYLQYSMAFENKQVKFYTIKTPVAKSFVQMIMRKGFPLRDRINFKIRFVPYDFSNDRFKRVARVTVQSVGVVCTRRRLTMCVFIDICVWAFDSFLLLALKICVALKWKGEWANQSNAQTHLLTDARN